jgi:hypothetical protein
MTAMFSICFAFYNRHWMAVDGMVLMAICLHWVAGAIREHASEPTSASRRTLAWAVAATLAWMIRWFLQMSPLFAPFRREHFYSYEFIVIGLVSVVMAGLCLRIKYVARRNRGSLE